MGLFVVDEKTCTRCGICGEACPAKIIAFRDQESVPIPLDGAEKFCLVCGHCVAICPPGALAHRRMSPAQCPPLQKDWLLSPERAGHFLRSRRSVRVYREQSVDRDTLAKLVEIASYAPTGHNSQTVNWLIISAPEDVQEMAGLVVDWMRWIIQESPQLAREMHLERIVTAWEKGIDRICRSAPHVIVAHAAKDDRFAPNSCPIALSYLELAAPTLGLGTCWGGYFTAAAGRWRPLQEALGLPEGHKCFGAVLAGYPKYEYHRLPLRQKPSVTWY